MRELELIDALRAGAGARRPAGARVLRWLGDDAAVVRGRGYAVTSVDTMVDGVHFRARPADAGRDRPPGARPARCLTWRRWAPTPARPTSRSACPPAPSSTSALALIAGARRARRTSAASTIAGGDVSASPVLSVTVTVVGWADDPAELVGRDGARPGDLVASPARWAAPGPGWRCSSGRADRLERDPRPPAARALRAPRPRLAAGRALRRSGRPR